jgi:chitodextrinase
MLTLLLLGSSSADTSAPSASTLAASGTTISSTNLSWTAATDNVGVTSYDVYQNGVFKATTSATSLVVSGLAASTSYNFYIKAKDAAGNVSTSSNTVNVTTLALADTTAPTASTLAASGTTTSGTNLSWTAATDNVAVTSYNVYQNGVLKTTTSTTSLAVSGLTASTSYNFYVRAKDAAGNLSTSSNTVYVTTLALADTTAPTVSTLAASGTTTSSTNLSWTAATDNVGVTSYDVYQNGVFKTNTSATSLVVSGLIASTSYNFYVKAKDAAGNVSISSNTVNVTTLSNVGLTTSSYCNSNGGTSREYINSVLVDSFTNTSGNDNGYGNYRSMSINLSIGATTKIMITPAWIGAARVESYNVWIDFNQNGSFESSELVFSKSNSRTKSVSGTLTIPTIALTGNTTMRVSMKYNSSPTSCEIFTNGEVEDYTINITSGTTRNSDPDLTSEDIKNTKVETEQITEATKLDFKLYPNPVKGDVVNFTGSENATSYRIYNQMGQQVASGYIENNSVNVGTLMPAIYIIEVSDGKSVSAKRFIKE